MTTVNERPPSILLPDAHSESQAQRTLAEGNRTVGETEACRERLGYQPSRVKGAKNLRVANHVTLDPWASPFHGASVSPSVEWALTDALG